MDAAFATISFLGASRRTTSWVTCWGSFWRLLEVRYSVFSTVFRSAAVNLAMVANPDFDGRDVAKVGDKSLDQFARF